VLIDGDYLLLIRGELFCVALDSVGSSAWGPGVLLVGGFGSYLAFNATRTACVLLTIPTTTEPCFTASDAYSTWKIRPWGELCVSQLERVGMQLRTTTHKVTESLS
jgi:hypothetical protein